MTEAFEGNGDYPNYGDGSSDFKRSKRGQDVSADEDTEEKVPNEKAAEYIRELLNERVQIDRKYPISDRLLEQEVQKVQQSGKIPPRENRYVDIYREKQIRVNVKVLVPVKEHPKFNFVGKLLGPKGNSMKRLQEDTMCKMAVLGRGSMKDRKREEELRASLEPKYAHLNDDLHVEISALAPPAEAHARIAYALAEVRKYLIPDSNDNIRREQIRELMSDGNPVHEVEVAEPRVIPPPRPPPVPTYYRAAPAPAPPPRTPSTRTVMPAKQKIMSILDRARSAMEESYGPPPTSTRPYEETVFEEPYEGYTYTHHTSTIPSRPRYEIPEYEAPDYRRQYYRASPTLKTSTSAPRASWKSSSGYGSSRGHEETSSKHHHSHTSRERYRSSPYQTSRPSKKQRT
ncbi:KH domain-containing, RNA-binding, signal transduction-associated protein 3-like isoform X1 [Lutzomyia longipalpis]|uniref:KH domain-containing, RNA-binding, signal transduction-associated protein 3-like isoform X1 n=1 Tax=Lutzomyia longipalpis TaxID=7200 RepID=UPI002483FC63|nr:KH domain-containing, RNA-binding, signal transduction-associated protein 3-like isoform X1 [Lutzomyia longipalpis]XP_055692422.1 KH domain-containing, RNA-binding, signal transduction-associated protein 3-like isoform X1 [Lutzomyia longipalpis]